VFPASRRILAYWLLLLIPALGVGIGAILLLRREQARLADRAAYADEARRAAVTARARLIAENVELLVGDVQDGLLDLLAAEPAGGGEAWLEQLEKTNPLVRTVFQCAPDGGVLRPAPGQADDNGRGFLRRFGARLRESPPWRERGAATRPPADQTGAATSPRFAAPGGAMSFEEQALTLADQAQKKESYDFASRQQVASNVAKVQSARRDVKALTKSNYLETGRLEADAPALDRAVSGAATEKRDYPVAASTMAVPSPADEINYRVAAAPSHDFAARDAVGPREERGWLPLKIDGRLHLLGWLQPADEGEVRGVELEMAALISRLGGALPAEISLEEGYALRDDQGRVLHQAGAVARAAAAAITVPLAEDLLPGWEVVAFVPAAAADSAGNGGFFLISMLLVGIFVAAIVAGGSLLLRQARRSEAEAAQKTSFVANVSHEFKTPLTTIRLYSELLEQGRVRDAAQSGEYLRTIGRETQRLARLVGNALDFSRLEQGRKKYAREPLDLRAELSRLLDTQAPRLAEAGLVLHRELPAQPLPVTSDRDAFEQILLNLLDNAAKYGAAGGEVTVELAPRPARSTDSASSPQAGSGQARSAGSGQARSTGSGQAGGAVVRVLDRGPGVPPEHRERIFEKFHRVDDTLTAEKAGAGLGLSIARQLARGLGGELRHLPREGGGAGFILELP
jgi:signal transduction histidine kinase